MQKNTPVNSPQWLYKQKQCEKTQPKVAIQTKAVRKNTAKKKNPSGYTNKSRAKEHS